jgi:hypothetical protein
MELGYEVVPIQFRRSLLGRQDKPLLQWCFENDYVIVTKNCKHYEALNELCQSSNGEMMHAGIIGITEAGMTAQEIINGLKEFLAARNPNDLVNCMDYLPIPPGYG